MSILQFACWIGLFSDKNLVISRWYLPNSDEIYLFLAIVRWNLAIFGGVRWNLVIFWQFQLVPKLIIVISVVYFYYWPASSVGKVVVFEALFGRFKPWGRIFLHFSHQKCLLVSLDGTMNGKPPTKVCQYSHIKADATPVMNKSFEKLLSNNFQVIIFERMAKNCFKVNVLSKIWWNLCFSIKK